MTALPASPRTVPSATRTGVRGAGLELTRRGRAVLAAVVFAAALLLTVLGMIALGVPSAMAGSEPAQVSVTVQEGDTLWGYAQEYAPADQDPRDFVWEVQQLNGLASSHLTAGMQIVVPTAAEEGR
ncbi:MAG: LysM peptidoglycan-binding domain-containing protein [Brachybacterium sp.]|nr:LysM peptidoglycan-binding domain-containing protein [Brachybacterium sp.]